jgi:excisionase family DNA binding protein
VHYYHVDQVTLVKDGVLLHLPATVSGEVPPRRFYADGDRRMRLIASIYDILPKLQGYLGYFLFLETNYYVLLTICQSQAYNGLNLLEGKRTVSDQYLRVRDAARLLGYSEDTIRNWINRPTHPLPATKVGRDWLIKKSDLDDFLNQMKNVRDDDEP